MKKNINTKIIKILMSILIFVFVIFLSSKVNASEAITKKLYQDITINQDGSITVKEMALLGGEYNGRSRQIEFKNYSANTFTGIYSNFTGNTDIYDGTSIKDIKIYDISQNNFNTIEDINKEEKVYQKVESAKNGRYGVYTLSQNSYEADFKIYCPHKKKKIFCMEYTITDVVVVHNDVAEFYWNVMGDNYREDIEDFQVLVHMPKEDNTLRVWTHGPLSGVNSIIDNKTVYFKDTNVDSYESETIRIMFDKELVPYATKKSNIDGKEFILQYEQTMADEANAYRNNYKLESINNASQAVLDLEKNKRMYYYNRALEYTQKLEDTEEKQQFLERINNTKEEVNQKWKEDLKSDIQWMMQDDYKYLTKYRFERFKQNIEDGFDEKAKEEFRKYIPIFENIFAKKDQNVRIANISIVTILYIILFGLVIYVLKKVISERKKYKGKYYREFPNDAEEPYVLEYLMKKKVTNLSISATILSLVTKKVIALEKNTQDEKDLVFVLNNDNYSGTIEENSVLKMLFKLVGTNNKCSMEALKKFGKKESNARDLTSIIQSFKKSTIKKAKNREYFNSSSMYIFFKIMIFINYFITSLMTFGVFKGKENAKGILIYLAVISILSIVYFIIVNSYKNRTEKGQLEYSKLLAHKRFLKDFSKFDEKDLPEIELWEKYLVTATILGCANKVEEKMKLYINNYDASYNDLLLCANISGNLIGTINSSINSSISKANYTISSSSSSSSGGGFGGGSSFGGGGRRWRRRRRTLLKIN